MSAARRSLLICSAAVIAQFACAVPAHSAAWTSPAKLPAEPLPSASSLRISESTVLIGDDGVAAVAWAEIPTAERDGKLESNPVLRLSRFRVGDVPPPPVSLISYDRDAYLGFYEGQRTPVRMAVGLGGEIVIVYPRFIPPGETGTSLVRVAADGTTSAPVDLGKIGGTEGAHPGQSGLALNSLSGTASVAWTETYLGGGSSANSCYLEGTDPIPQLSQSLKVNLTQVRRDGTGTTIEVGRSTCATSVVARALNDGSTLVAWVTDAISGGRANVIRARRVQPDGTLGPPLTTAPLDAAVLRGVPAIGGDGSISGLHFTDGGGLALNRMNGSGVVAPTIDMAGTSTPDWQLHDVSSSGSACSIVTRGNRVRPGGPGSRYLWMTDNDGFYRRAPYGFTGASDGGPETVDLIARPSGGCTLSFLDTQELVDPSDPTLGHAASGVGLVEVNSDGTIDPPVQLSTTDEYRRTGAAASAPALATDKLGNQLAVYRRWERNAERVYDKTDLWIVKKLAGPQAPAPVVPQPTLPEGTPAPGANITPPICNGVEILCVQPTYATAPTPGAARKPCDPGADTGWINVAGTTFACIFTGEIWDDPTLLSAKQKCVFNLSIDALAFAKLLKLPKYLRAAGTAKVALSKVASQLRKASYSRKLSSDAKTLDDLKASLGLIKGPEQALYTAVSSRRVIDALIIKLGKQSPEALQVAKNLALTKAAVDNAIAVISGAQDIGDCVLAFSAS